MVWASWAGVGGGWGGGRGLLISEFFDKEIKFSSWGCIFLERAY